LNHSQLQPAARLRSIVSQLCDLRDPTACYTRDQPTYTYGETRWGGLMRADACTILITVLQGGVVRCRYQGSDQTDETDRVRGWLNFPKGGVKLIALASSRHRARLALAKPEQSPLPGAGSLQHLKGENHLAGLSAEPGLISAQPLEWAGRQM
jgi:hypothetical protein